MQTILLDATTPAYAVDAVARAIEILRTGRLVAFPTETVYGLGADARSDEAVARIYQAKGRPSHNPLIVHVPDVAGARALAGEWNAMAEKLAARFWPGPLTIVVPAGLGLAASVLAGGDTVGLRVPAHPLALRLLRESGLPLAAPSANASNRISPTTAEAVLDSLDGLIDAVLDGGACTVGIESTVIDVTGDVPAILRPGRIGRGELSALLGVEVRCAGDGGGGALRSPGMMPRHYAPQVPLRLGGDSDAESNAFRIRFGDRLEETDAGIVLPRTPTEAARWLYWALRRGETSGAEAIEVQGLPDGEGWEAIRDRLSRAATSE